jgi:hypothetical protein
VQGVESKGEQSPTLSALCALPFLLRLIDGVGVLEMMVVEDHPV